MSSSTKTWYGVLAFLPIALFIGYFISFISLFAGMIRHEDQMQDNMIFFSHFAVAFAFIIAAVIATITALIVFLIHALNSKTNPENERIIWVIVFLFAGPIGYPIYWYMRILKHPVQTSNSVSSL